VHGIAATTIRFDDDGDRGAGHVEVIVIVIAAGRHVGTAAAIATAAAAPVARPPSRLPPRSGPSSFRAPTLPSPAAPPECSSLRRRGGTTNM
jgi:hypothetical protein